MYNIYRIFQEKEMQCNDLYKALENCSIPQESLFKSYWYTFYDNAYAELITSHAALFGGLIATAIAIFGFKYWLEYKKFNDIVDDKLADITEKNESLKKKIANAEKRLKSLEKMGDNLSNQPQKFYLKSIILNKGMRGYNTVLLSAIKEWLDSCVTGPSIYMAITDFKDVFNAVKETISKERLNDSEKKIAQNIKEKLEKAKANDSDQLIFFPVGDMIQYFDDLSK